MKLLYTFVATRIALIWLLLMWLAMCRQLMNSNEFFALIELLYVFFARHKVHEVFVKLQTEQGLVPRELGRMGDTRWACRYQNMSVVKERFAVIVLTLCEVQSIGDADIRVQAKGLIDQVRSCPFAANLEIFHKILSTCYGVTEALQSSAISISQSVNLIIGMINTMTELHEKPEIWNNVQRDCEENEISVECLVASGNEQFENCRI